MRERTRLADTIERQRRLEQEFEDGVALAELAEEEGEFAGGGVLVTGSVITVGEARLLLGKG